MKRSILIILAHPDDESCLLGGTIAKYSRQSIPVDLICATRGEKGTRLGVPKNVDTGKAREEELRSAANILGIRHIYLLDYSDTGLISINLIGIVNRVIEIMKKLQPEVVITFGPDGISGHNDHITIGKAVTIAFEKLKTGGEVLLRKLYYITMPKSAFPEFLDSGIATRSEDEITTAIDISGYLEFKLKAIAVYRSQQDTRRCLEIIKKYRESLVTSMEFLYLAIPKACNTETDLFQ